MCVQEGPGTAPERAASAAAGCPQDLVPPSSPGVFMGSKVINRFEAMGVGAESEVAGRLQEAMKA